MLKWREDIFEGDSAEPMARRRKQDDEFCRRLLVAVQAGHEFCPTTVNSEPCTKRLILNCVRPD